jgi:hypothetical protein
MGGFKPNITIRIAREGLETLAKLLVEANPVTL